MHIGPFPVFVNANANETRIEMQCRKIGPINERLTEGPWHMFTIVIYRISRHLSNISGLRPYHVETLVPIQSLKLSNYDLSR